MQRCYETRTLPQRLVMKIHFDHSCQELLRVYALHVALSFDSGLQQHPTPVLSLQTRLSLMGQHSYGVSHSSTSYVWAPSGPSRIMVQLAVQGTRPCRWCVRLLVHHRVTPQS